ncbi:MAG TPA: hypothetical protein DCR14_02230 [Acidimicrobiaceae bacterium]|nr:hypothetical protein [Acidimicrobiaceae bacterium]
MSETLDTVTSVPAEVAAPTNRRRFLRLAGAATLGGAAVSSLAPSTAQAATGGALLIGQGNSPTNTTDVTSIVDPSNSALCPVLFRAANYTTTNTSAPSTQRIALFAFTSGADSGDGYPVGVYGRASKPGSNGGCGVFGSAGGPENPFEASSLNVGVMGTSNQMGVVGVSNSADGVAVAAYNLNGGASVFVGGSGILRFERQFLSGPITSGTHSAGEVICDGVGDVYVCSAGGSPGTWRKVARTYPGYEQSGGTVNLLAKPIRLFDSRGIDPDVPFNHGSVKVAAGETVVVQVTGTVAQSLSVPAGASAVMGNLTAVQVNGSGWATVWPSGDTPSTSNLNYNSSNAVPAIANSFMCALDDEGKLRLKCSSNAAHMIIDITGFIA